ncbi:ABC transporter permease/substrate-binding protein [Peptoniphilus sp. KCTC 25270]|uniref:ABC transporter permease/substrate-binding protein n=1 Tax=Peptoniphilus sp. KCTC 25270 TaxID=2897414 RepID=UPI001E65471C|nr:ABC transporter permease/substrate-binding protein [Peptoniphilus sp. KCTC 25270]MCD1146582.1 ABC transporter permease/substrate-binding protein [Peptoniphilus sp. KCTC 25270]
MNNTWNLLTTNGDFFLRLFIEHLQIAGTSIFIASILGLAIGILITRYEKIAEFVLGFVNIVYTIPSIALLGILVAFTGIGNTTAIIALTIYALLPMVRSTYTGIKNINPNIIEAAYGMGSTDREVLTKITLPLALPVIMTGLRNMVTMTIALAGIASFVGAGGLGVAIFRGITTNKTEMILAGSILVALLALLCDFILGRIENRIENHKKVYGKILIPLAALLLIVPMVLSSISGNRTIHIATKPTTENYITGQITKLLIEEMTDLEPIVTSGVAGGTSNIHPAMEKGDFDIYTEYTGTAWQVILKREDHYDESKFEELKQAYEEECGLTFDGMFGFNNTYGIAVLNSVAERYNLETYSDLGAVSSALTFGAEADFFEREDGYQALVDTYGFEFGSISDMDVGLKYKAIQQEEMDAMVIYTTDGQLSSTDVKVLEDDKKLYPSYLAGNVVRMDTLESHPELQEVLDAMDGLIGEEEMIEMNNKVESLGETPENVAREFLLSKGMIKEEGKNGN